jgi:hypothetical protein
MQTRSGKVLEPLKKKNRAVTPNHTRYINNCMVCAMEWYSTIDEEYCSDLCR